MNNYHEHNLQLELRIYLFYVVYAEQACFGTTKSYAFVMSKKQGGGAFVYYTRCLMDKTTV